MRGALAWGERHDRGVRDTGSLPPDASRRKGLACFGAGSTELEMRAAVIGYGYWGPKLARNIAACEGCEVEVVAEVNPARLDRARRDGYARLCTSDAEAAIDDPRVDAVVVAVPVTRHFEIARAALAAGKHVLVEKPMARSVAEAESLIALATARRRVLMVDHTFAYSGAVELIRRLIDEGKLGALTHFDSTRMNLGIVQEDVSVLWDLAAHDLSILAFLHDEHPLRVHATGGCGPPGQPHVGHLTLEYDSGFHAHVGVSWISPVKLRPTLIGGKRRSILYDDLHPSEKVRVYDIGPEIRSDDDRSRRAFELRASDVWVPLVSQHEPLAHVVGDFVSACSQGTLPRASMSSGLWVVRVLAAADESLARGGSPVTIEW